MDGRPAWQQSDAGLGRGQVKGRRCNLEVGDPLTGTLFPSGGAQRLYLPYAGTGFLLVVHGGPSIGLDSDFSNNDAFTLDAGTVLARRVKRR